MYAATVDVLVRKGKFEPPIAVAVAEAIDMAINNAQLVTVPVMDARFAAFEAKMDARFAAVQSDLNAHFSAMEAKIEARIGTSEARTNFQIAALRGEMNSRFDSQEERLDAKLAHFKTDLTKFKTELVFWIVAAMLGTNYLPKIADGIAGLISMVAQGLR